MAIITKEFIERFTDYPIRSQESAKDPLVIVKLFDIAGSASWYLIEFDPNEKIAFGYVTGLEFDEWGDVYIPELEAISLFGIPRIERDIHFVRKSISEIMRAGK